MWQGTFHPTRPGTASALAEMFTEFDPHWFRPAPRFQRAVIHETGYKYVRQHWLTLPPPGNAQEEFLHLPSDSEESTQLAVFNVFSDGASPCVCVPAPPCTPPGPCIPLRMLAFLDIVCATGQTLCDPSLFQVIFDRHYAPLYCSCTTSD
jgi:hypothetical protein